MNRDGGNLEMSGFAVAFWLIVFFLVNGIIGGIETGHIWPGNPVVEQASVGHGNGG